MALGVVSIDSGLAKRKLANLAAFQM